MPLSLWRLSPIVRTLVQFVPLQATTFGVQATLGLSDQLGFEAARDDARGWPPV